MPTPEEIAAQEAEKSAAQAAAEEAARRAAEQSGEDSGLPDDPKVLKQVIAQTRKEAASRRTQANEMKARLDAMEAEKRKAEETALAEQGKFKELAEQRQKDLEARQAELEQARAKLATFEAREANETKRRAAQVDADFAALPEEIRAEFPDADQRTKEVAIKLYQKASGKLPTKPPTLPSTAPQPPGSVDGLLSDAEFARLSQASNDFKLSPADRAKAKDAVVKHIEAKRAQAR